MKKLYHIFVQKSSFNNNYRLALPNTKLVKKGMNAVEKNWVRILSHRYQALIMHVTNGNMI